MIDIASLVKRLEEANVAYRNGNPIMSDAAYDALEDQLRNADPNHPFLSTVGSKPSSAWIKAAHAIPMGSLAKCQFNPTFDDKGVQVDDGHGDLRSWWASLPVTINPKIDAYSIGLTHDNRVLVSPVTRGGDIHGNPRSGQSSIRVTISQKLDGISIGLTYVNRVLVSAVTRGDGIQGEDITRNVLLMEGVVRILPPTLCGRPTPDKVYVRGEIVCRKSKFAAHFPGESNPRNTAAGTSKSISGGEKCKYLTVLAYQCLPNGMALPSKEDEFKALTEAGFLTPPVTSASTVADVIAVYDRYVAHDRDALDWEIDGLVLDISDSNKRESLGVSGNRPRGSIAMKFPHAQKTSRIRNIVWQTGKSGRITPVAEFDEVDLAGVRVKRASLHNIGYIKTLAEDAGVTCLSEGDEILVSRRNDVIPAVEALLKPNGGTPFATALVCPVCSSTLQTDGAYLVCVNDACGAQVRGALKRWVEKTGTKHFGGALIDLLCELGLVETIADLYELEAADVAALEFQDCRRVGGVADKAISNLHANKSMTLDIFLGSLGIPGVGRSTVRAIMDGGYDTFYKIIKAKAEDIAKVPGIGQNTAEAFLDGIWGLMRRNVIQPLFSHITIVDKTTGPLSGKTVCMTGFRDAAMERAVEAKGGTIKSGVSKDLTYLVADDPSSNSGKAAKARQYGVTILSIKEMWAMLA